MTDRLDGAHDDRQAETPPSDPCDRRSRQRQRQRPDSWAARPRAFAGHLAPGKARQHPPGSDPGDAQRYKLGVNVNHIPVKTPQCPFHSYHRDGATRTDGNMGRTPT
ncbi:MAG: catalase [Roseiarcus sp.]